ncbi:hypothetical protein Tco_0682004 [Tanacetum coccineum]|uniref:Uncharacterized protein n=1 Tax=Tanacetum coccineum TaxID=301880 RepID=A0ABQ4XQ13_9ASTR
MIVMTSMIDLESLFGHLFDEYLNRENQVVSKSSAITTADASVKRQQQLDSSSPTSTLATTVTANGNFDVVQRIILVILLEHQNDTLLVFTVTMEILSVSTSNNIVVGPHRTRGTIVGVATSFQLCRNHYHMLMLKALRSNIQDHDLSSKIFKVIQDRGYCYPDEEEDIGSFQVKYEHDGQKHKLIKKVKSR